MHISEQLRCSDLQEYWDLRVSTFYQMFNSGWRKLENPLLGLALVDLRLPSTYTLLLVVAGGEICHCHPDNTLKITVSFVGQLPQV